MAIKEIDSNILISFYDNFYLICNTYHKPNYEYYIGYDNGSKTKFAKREMVTSPATFKELYNNADFSDIETLIKKSNRTQAEEHLTRLYSQIKSFMAGDGTDEEEANKIAEKILEESLTTLGDIEEESKGNNESIINNSYLSNITNETVINKLVKLSDSITQDKNSTIILADAGTKGLIMQYKNHPAHKDGLYYEKTTYNTKGEEKIHYTLIGNILINKLTLTYDKLSIFDAVATIQYTNTLTNQVVTIEKQPYEAIANNLVRNRLIDADSKGVEKILNKIWVNGANNIDFIHPETDLLKDGFFMDMEANKVLSNNVFENLETSEKEVREAINLFNELIRGRGTAVANDCLLFRFMLWSPFAYCLKQLGYTDGLYNMVLWGITDTSKTGSSVMFSYLYTDKATTLQKANTQSAIGTRLGENTFPLILDEAKDILDNPSNEEFLKNIVTDEIGRAVKDRTNNNLMVEFPAIRGVVFTLNPPVEYKPEFYKRYRVLYYDGSMQVKESDKIEFNKKFKPNTPATPLHQLKHLGKAFADRFIPYLESQSDELYDLDNLTIKILKQIEKDFNCNKLFNTDVMRPHTDRLTTHTNEDYGSMIRTALNQQFTKGYKIPYDEHRNQYAITDFKNCIKNGMFENWLDYQPTNHMFIIKVKAFEKEIANIIGEYLETSQIMKLLNIKWDNNKGKRIKFHGNSTQAIKINEYYLTYTLFGVRVTEFDRIKEKAGETEEGETEEP